MAIELFGNWDKGFAFQLHTLKSEHIGTDQFGHDAFDTTYTEMGKLVKSLKYRGNKGVVIKIVGLLGNLEWIKKHDVIIPVPPSNINRPYQPVDEIAMELGKRANVPVKIGGLVKIGSSKELKNVTDHKERIIELRKTIALSDKLDIAGKKILLVDDLFRSGATLSVSTEVLRNEGGATKVSVLVMTKTRSNR